MKKQTAVEWLMDRLPTIDKNDPYYEDIIQQAKAHEKLNIYMAYLEGHRKDFNSKDEALFLMYEYYNETFGS
jgi:hypothetical protein